MQSPAEAEAPPSYSRPVGDILNATARIEALTKSYSVVFLTTAEVLSSLPVKPEHRLLDRVIVRGKTTPLDLIELRHPFNALRFERTAADYSTAFQLYQRGEFAEAARLFQILAPEDPPSRLLASRCAALAVDPPGEWNGVFKLET